MFKLTEIKKSFQDLIAVNSVSFSIKKGEIYGLLGPNGAGKSTIINMITGLLKPDKGAMSFNDYDCTGSQVKFKQKLGVAPQEIALYEDLSALENLKFWASIHGVSSREIPIACNKIAESVGLQDRLKDKVKTFSGGMKRRLNLAAAILHKPELLLLDEPTAGVDPQSRYHIMQLVRQLADQGTSVLYTTHYLEEAESICDRIGIIDNGYIIAEGTLHELCESVKSGRIVSLEGSFDVKESNDVITRHENLQIVTQNTDRIIAKLDSDETLIAFMKEVFNTNLKIQSVSVKPPSLETVFLILTGKELRD